MFISEIAETSLRGALGAFFQLFLTVGILYVYVAGALMNWILLSWSCLLFPILLILTVFFIPDSPIYLVKQVNICSQSMPDSIENCVNIFLIFSSFVYFVPSGKTSRSGRGTKMVLGTSMQHTARPVKHSIRSRRFAGRG